MEENKDRKPRSSYDDEYSGIQSNAYRKYLRKKQAAAKRRKYIILAVCLCAAAAAVALIILMNRNRGGVAEQVTQQGELNAGETAEATLAVETIAAETAAPQETTAAPETTEETSSVFAGEDTVSILCAGDNLIHSVIYEQAWNDDGYYDFSYLYHRVRDYIEDADIATINQETVLADDVLPLSGYPSFNAPQDVGDALIEAGFDIINMANNHVMDWEVEGVSSTLDYWEEKGIPVVGIYRNQEDRDTIRVIDCNNIRVAFLGFAEMTNVPVPEDTEYCYVDLDNPDLCRQQIEAARELADVVVVHAHWGEENEWEQTELMTDMMHNMVEWGADIIFGNHPHLLQKMETFTRSSDGKECVGIYSIGNFVSGQIHPWQLVSGMMTVRVAKDRGNGATRIEKISFLPTITHYYDGRSSVSIYPINQYSEELAEEHGVHNYEGGYVFSMDYIWDVVHNAIPEEYIIPE